MTHLRLRAIAAACAVASLATTLALAMPRMASAAQTIPSGYGLNGSLNNALDTKSSYAGQPVSISVVAPYPNGVSSLAGSTIYGHVGEAVSGGRGRNPQLSIVLDKIKYRNGSSAQIGAVVSKLEPKKDKHGRVLLGTAGGMFLGNWAGKALFGGSAGGAVGAATGFLLSSNNKQDFHVPAGSPVGIQLTRSLSVP
ncbi:MAG: hypothetical protein JO219_11075 [Candidatus Eremiobacteraeota bacterium]|nr:hypothetical protein [Candidatus Eremiobacteraeota bacterium]MBV8366402.1 hypothetical protein [Candidatus Eremiobacteraeota bacterium]